MVVGKQSEAIVVEVAMLAPGGAPHVFSRKECHVHILGHLTCGSGCIPALTAALVLCSTSTVSAAPLAIGTSPVPASTTSS